MAEDIETSIVIQQRLLSQVEIVAKRLNLSRDALVAMALQDFVLNHQGDGGRVVNQGDIFWVNPLSESEASIRHPHVVIQDNVINHSRIQTVVACALTTNIKRASLPGNVLLDAGEANLAKQSVVEVSKISAVDKAQLGDYIGSLSEGRVGQIVDGIRFVQVSFFERSSANQP